MIVKHSRYSDALGGRKLEKKKTVVHILGAIFLVWFAIVMFRVASGSISMLLPFKENGAVDFSNRFKLLIPYALCMVVFAGLIVILNDGEFMEWLPSAGIILGLTFGGALIGFYKYICVLLSLVYAVWWLIASFRNLKSAWDGPAFIMALCRICLTAAICGFVLGWAAVPTESVEIVAGSAQAQSFTIAGILALVGAGGLVGEAFLWIKYCEY